MLDGGSGSDFADYYLSGSGVSVNLTTNVNTGGDAAGDTLFSIEHIRGSSSNDTLVGDGAANVIYGNSGTDAILGMGGMILFMVATQPTSTVVTSSMVAQAMI